MVDASFWEKKLDVSEKLNQCTAPTPQPSYSIQVQPIVTYRSMSHIARASRNILYLCVADIVNCSSKLGRFAS